MSRRDRRVTSDYSPIRGARPRIARGHWLGSALGLVVIVALLALASQSVQTPGSLASLPDVPAALAAEAAAAPAHLELAPLPALRRSALGSGAALPAIITTSRATLGVAAPDPSVYVALLTYTERNASGSPISGGKSSNSQPVYILYYQGLSGFATGGRAYTRFLFSVDIASGEQITGSGLP